MKILSFQAEKKCTPTRRIYRSNERTGETFKLVRSELSTIEHDLESTSALFQRLIQQSSPLQQEWQQAEKKTV